jgi:hypothetical protein
MQASVSRQAWHRGQQHSSRPQLYVCMIHRGIVDRRALLVGRMLGPLLVGCVLASCDMLNSLLAIASSPKYLAIHKCHSQKRRTLIILCAQERGL